MSVCHPERSQSRPGPQTGERPTSAQPQRPRSLLAPLCSGIARRWPLLLPLVLLLPGAGGFPYPAAQGLYSDLAISHYPYAVYIQRSLAAGQGLPLWSTQILSGHPLAANPLASLWYPPGWLALCLPLPLGLNLLAAAHLIWAGLGLARLLRLEGLGWRGALFGGVAFAFLPKFYGHYGAGHLTLLYAVAWTPWLLWAAARSRTGVGQQPGRKLRRLASLSLAPGVILALIFLADPRWAPFAGAVWWGYTLAHAGSADHPGTAAPGDFAQAALARLARKLPALAANAALAAGLAAPLGLPLWELARRSTRAGLNAADVLRFSLPPARLFGYLFPELGGFHEWIVYPGGVTLLLAALGVLFMGKTGSGTKLVRLKRGALAAEPGAPAPLNAPPAQGSYGQEEGSNQDLGSGRIWGFWIATAALALLFSLGANLPAVEALARLPGIAWLRVPPRALFLAGLALAALAALAVDRLAGEELARPSRAAGRVLVALAGFGVALALGVWGVTGRLPASFAWGAGVLLAGAVWTGARLAGRVSGRAWYAGVLVLCCFDLLGVDRTLFNVRPAAEVLSEQQALAGYLQSQPGPFRVYSPSYSLPQQSAAQAGIELADGIDPLQLKTYAKFMETASGVPVNGYSVTLPPLEGGDAASANAAYLPDAQTLGLLNVRYIAAEFDLPPSGVDETGDLVLRGRFGRTRLYENLQARPRAWLQASETPIGQDVRMVTILSRTPGRIEIQAENDTPSPALLVLSELDYPGWEARLDGRSVPIQAVAGLLRGVFVPAGQHRVVFTFRPKSVAWGAGLSSAAVCLLLGRWMWANRSRRANRRAMDGAAS